MPVFSNLGLSLEILQTPNFNVFFSCRTLILPENLRTRAHFLQTRGEFGDSPNSGLFFSKLGLSLRILQSQACFLQTQVQFRSSPTSGPVPPFSNSESFLASYKEFELTRTDKSCSNSGPFSANWGLRLEILQTQFVSPNSARA